MSRKLFTQTKPNDEVMRNIKRTLFYQAQPNNYTQPRQINRESICVCSICKSEFFDTEGSTRKSVGNTQNQVQQTRANLQTRPFSSDISGSQQSNLIPSQQLQQSVGDSVPETKFQTPYRSQVQETKLSCSKQFSVHICPSCQSKQSQNTQKKSQSLIESYEINNSCEYESSVQYNPRNININTILEQLDEEDTFYNVGFNQFKHENKIESNHKEDISGELDKPIQPIKSLVHRSQSQDFKSTPSKTQQGSSYEKAQRGTRNGKPPLPNSDESYSSVQQVPGATYPSILKNSDDSKMKDHNIPTLRYNTRAKSSNALNFQSQNKSFDNQSSRFVTPPKSNCLPKIHSSRNSLQIIKETSNKTSRLDLAYQVTKLCCGFYFKKYGRQDHFFPSKRLIQLTPDLKFLICRDENSEIKKLIALTDITGIKLGRKTENFKRFSSDTERGQRSFSLMLKERTFDLEAQSNEELNYFVNVLDRVEKLINLTIYKGVS